MTTQTSVFAQRLRRIDKRKRKLSRGVKTRMDSTGLVHEVPATQIRMPLRPLVYVVLGFLVFKGWLIHNLGLAEYGARLSGLAEGTLAETVSAVIMQPDPVTMQIAQVFSVLF